MNLWDDGGSSYNLIEARFHHHDWVRRDNIFKRAVEHLYMQSGVPGLQFCVFARVASIFKRGLLCWYNLEIATSLLNLHNTLRCSTLSWNHINRKTFPTLILRRLIFPELSALPSLSLPLSFPENIRSHLQTTIHPQTLGITKVLFFKAGPVHLLPRVCGCGSREGGKLLRPCSPRTPLPVACLLGGSPLRVS